MERIIASAQEKFRLITVGYQAGSTFWPVAALITAVVLWGGSFVAMRVAVTAIGPMAVMWCRMMIALSDRYNPWGLTALQIVAGAVFFLPGAYWLTRIPGEGWTLSLLLSLIFLGGFVTFGAFGLYNWGISHIRAAKASSFINLVPVVAVILGWAVLEESLSSRQCLAALAVIAGVMLSQAGDKLNIISQKDY
ncbi:MAG: protein of unknown function DUF6 transmembrane [uncultured bacterium]|nr:MAG: protein of unknown function DUF6 transmembrane [uncultured bacterium]